MAAAPTETMTTDQATGPAMEENTAASGKRNSKEADARRGSIQDEEGNKKRTLPATTNKKPEELDDDAERPRGASNLRRLNSDAVRVRPICWDLGKPVNEITKRTISQAV